MRTDSFILHTLLHLLSLIFLFKLLMNWLVSFDVYHGLLFETINRKIKVFLALDVHIFIIYMFHIGKLFEHIVMHLNLYFREFLYFLYIEVLKSVLICVPYIASFCLIYNVHFVKCLFHLGLWWNFDVLIWFWSIYSIITTKSNLPNSRI